MISRKVSLSVVAAATAAATATAVAPGLLLSPAAAATAAFPGAEGFGTGTPGGRGGAVCKVVNLNDAGPGSLRSCVEASGPRYVVFDVGGTISLKSRITATNPFLTIAGQTAPGGGITLRMDPSAGTDQGTMQIETHDVVVRYLRFRPGNGGAADDSHDAITIYKAGVSNVVVDHSSFSWAVDENVNTYDQSTDITISNSIIAEGLSNAGHPLGEHSKGLLSGGVNAHNVSIHHNLFVSNVDRNPQISGVSVADIRNNVVYNYGDGSGSGVTLISSSKGQPRVNWVGNYYKPGPQSDPARPEFATYNGDTGATHQWYGEGNRRWTAAGDQDARIGQAVGRVSTPFAAAPVTTTRPPRPTATCWPRPAPPWCATRSTSASSRRCSPGPGPSRTPPAPTPHWPPAAPGPTRTATACPTPGSPPTAPTPPSPTRSVTSTATATTTSRTGSTRWSAR